MACSTGTKYTICVLDPANSRAVCNKTGNQHDNFDVPFSAMENFVAMPPGDAKDILRRVKVCEGGRRGD